MGKAIALSARRGLLSHLKGLLSHGKRAMHLAVSRGVVWLLTFWIGAMALPAAEDLPAASDVVARVLERARQVAKERQPSPYVYEKRSITAELDERGRIIKSTEKHYEVVLIGGLPFPRLVKVQGRELTPAELQRQNERELAFRQRVTRVDFKRKAQRREALATKDLVDRFHFKVARREWLEGRSVLVLSFAPKPGNPETTIEDKVYNRVFGTVWVDEDDAEVAKLDAQVRGPIPLGWFGAIGSLNTLHATFDRVRLPDGVWVNRNSSFHLIARKLFSAVRYRTTEQSSGFRLAAAPSAVGGSGDANSDWPQFLGPGRNGAVTRAGIAAAWPKEGPRIAWKFSAGQGWSGPVVVSNRVILFHRVDDHEMVDCLSLADGSRIWRAQYPTTYRDDFGFDEGPRATPAVHGNRLFTVGADGVLNCWQLSDGTNVWRVNLRERFRAGKGFFGVACSPLVEGNAVILNVGGNDGAGVVAFDMRTGEVLWKATEQGASYSSPVAATLGGQRRILVFGRSGLVALNAADGKVLWEFPWKPRIDASVSAATPLVVNEHIFISASYGAGAALLRFSESGPEVVWSGDDILSNHYATSVYHDGLLFGFDGRQEERPRLRCVDWKTGKVRWTEERFGAGTAIVADGHLLVLTERGELLLAPASSQKFSPVARAQILGSDVRAHGALAGGRFLARDKRQLVCVDLRGERAIDSGRAK